MAYLELGDHKLSRIDVQDLLATDHPMVEQFRFDKQRAQAGQSVDFALIIVPKSGVRYWQQRDDRGAPIEPAERRLTGRERVGRGHRGMWVEGGEIMATNHSFFPNQVFNDLGIGSALYVAMERLYRQLGIRRVSLLAVDVGVYVWARQAFAFEESGMARDLAARLEGYLALHDIDADVDESKLRESWALANFEAEGGTIDGYRAGKAFMLDEAGGWYGYKLLDDPRHSQVAEQSRRETFARLPGKIDGATGELRVC